jgi:hypothetical protein
MSYPELTSIFDFTRCVLKKNGRTFSRFVIRIQTSPLEGGKEIGKETFDIDGFQGTIIYKRTPQPEPDCVVLMVIRSQIWNQGNGALSNEKTN